MIDVRPATGADWTVIAWLWQAYRNDLSAIVDGLPREDGRFNHAWLDGWADSDEAAGYLVREGDAPIGFAVVNRLTDGPHGIGAFWVVPARRRGGVGWELALEVIRRHPGDWEIAFQRDNTEAGKFWRRVADEAFGDWSEEARAVPGKPDVPPDTWLSGSNAVG